MKTPQFQMGNGLSNHLHACATDIPNGQERTGTGPSSTWANFPGQHARIQKKRGTKRYHWPYANIGHPGMQGSLLQAFFDNVVPTMY